MISRVTSDDAESKGGDATPVDGRLGFGGGAAFSLLERRFGGAGFASEASGFTSIALERVVAEETCASRPASRRRNVRERM